LLFAGLRLHCSAANRNRYNQPINLLDGAVMAVAHDLTIRAGGHADLPAVMDIWYANEVGDDPQPPARPPTLPDYPHLLATGRLWVAEQGGRVVGFSGAVVRGTVAFLTDLFVGPEHQSTGVGARLLSQALDPHAGLTRCTVSSTDPRALALYTRYGLLPQWPNFLLRSHRPRPELLLTAEIEAVEALPGDPAIIAWDAEIGGRERPADHAYWAASEGGVALWLLRGGEPIGYAIARLRAGTIWQPGAARVGPVGVLQAEEAGPALCAAIAWAATRADAIRVDLPGPHPGLAGLLEAGFRIGYIETFMLDSPRPFFNPRCYVGSGGALF
jgi:ribosomal protein S18 acetylase RimI-like enzyme